MFKPKLLCVEIDGLLLIVFELGTELVMMIGSVLHE